MSAKGAPATAHLRVSYVWRDEVMGDDVLLEPRAVRIGTTADATFTTGAHGLPNRFELLRPGARGYVLTLGAHMGGTMQLGGQQLQVRDFVARGGGERAEGAAGAFRATPISPGDWGVIELDETGDHAIFFQFVKPEAPLARRAWKDHELVVPALVFALALHAVLLTITFVIRSDHHSLMFPGNADLAANYLVRRPEVPPEPELSLNDIKAGIADGEKNAELASTDGESGKSGGEGDKPRKRSPDPIQGDPKDPMLEKVQTTGLLKHRESLRGVAGRGGHSKRLGNALARLRGDENNGGPGGYGSGRGTGVGPGEGTGTTRGGTGDGPGGGGRAPVDIETVGIHKHGTRAPRGVPGGKGVKEVAVAVKTGDSSGDFQGLTKEQIDKLVRKKRNAILSCYERQLQRKKGLEGTVVVVWTITPDGEVKRGKIKKTTLGDPAAEDCIVRQLERIKFPKAPNGKPSVVTYPFIFSQG